MSKNKPTTCDECGGPLVYGETFKVGDKRAICARCQVMNDAQNDPEWAR